ncbi:hypothetical protein RZS08_51225, partial [Arthrospira platensis SPKY1]|nr:hypothetical protein [Arthrospira platensis SPKY1]
PVLVHVNNLTQPLGHSTSGSHERYKSEDRLRYEQEADCIAHFIRWILENGISDEEQIAQLKQKAREYTIEKKNVAWNRVKTQMAEWKQKLQIVVNAMAEKEKAAFSTIVRELETTLNPGLS